MRWSTGLLLGLALLMCGCSSNDTEHLAQIGHMIAARVETVTADPNSNLAKGWQTVRGGVDEASLQARIETRMRWDKNLAEVGIQASVQGGVVELKGSVRDIEQRRRAVDLAESTTGVEKVVDLLTIATES